MPLHSLPTMPPRPRRRALVAALLLPACGAADGPASGAEITRYQAALERVASDPVAAAAACAELRQEALRDDCTSAAAEALARQDATAAGALCGQLPEGPGRDECYFQVAEYSREVQWCARAGRFADDCRLHRFSKDLGRLVPPGTGGPGAFEAELARSIAAYGLSADDPRPWSAAYRWVLGQQRPLDRHSCEAAPASFQVEACRHTGIALYQDRLNQARDTRAFPCPDGPLPDSLLHAPDAELDAILAQRRQEDLCP